MKKAIETLQDLIDEAKIRTVGWALCIFAISYFLSHTSKSMWTNIPISILLLSAFRILSHEVEFRWKVHPVRRRTYLSHLEKKQLSLEDPRLSNPRPSSKWKRKIESPVVEAAIEEFINKILQDFVVDLWYSVITPDREAPEQMRLLINDVLGEISGRVKAINLVNLLTRDMVDLIGNHLDLYRRNQSAIGVKVMGTLSSEERDERLKHHLIASKELHPALFSPECEYKVLQRLMGGVLAVVLKPRDAQCPLVRSIGRELLTCLVMQPIMNFACPGYINELIEYLFLNAKDDKGDDQSAGASSQCQDHTEPNLRKSGATSNTRDDLTLAKISNDRETSLSTSGHGHSHVIREDSVQPRPADWARVLEAATQRRSEVLAPENLENMWARGRNYKSKLDNHVKAGKKPISVKKSPEMLTNSPGTGNHVGKEGKVIVQVTHGVSRDTQLSDEFDFESQSQKQSKGLSLEGASFTDKLADHAIRPAYGSKTQLKRSNSTSALKIQPDIEKTITGQGRVAVFSEQFDPPNFVRHKEEEIVRTVCDTVFRGDGILHIPKVKCRVVGAYFEKTGSKSFAVYSIAVTDVENKTWFVKRRYRNFERLHRHLKDIPNYALHLPPKRFLSSSVDDSFVHQRCIQLDQYLQDLLSIANVAEQHEVWDFLSASSKNYSFGKSTSVMKSLAVNVDDAMDDILRQFKGVSGGLMRKVTGSPSLPCAPTSISGKNLSWNGDEMNKSCNDMETSQSYHDMETSHSLSDNEEHYLDGDHGNEEVVSGVQVNGWHSDNELNSKSFPPRVIKRDQQSRDLSSEQNRNSEAIYGRMGSNGATELVEDPIGMPPEWTPPNVSVPLLNLVDNIFQLNRRGWLRRQVFWISKQILQLMMEDAIDDWIVRQIHWLRRDDIIALGIRWVQDVLWPKGTFFLKLESSQGNMDETQFDQRSMQTAGHSTGNRAPKLGSLFELQREAARRASDVEKMILGGAPTTLVSLIGNKQYKRCAKDIYYFLQSNICVKQLAYGMLELLLVSIFPELQNLVLNMHEERRAQQA